MLASCAGRSALVALDDPPARQLLCDPRLRTAIPQATALPDGAAVVRPATAAEAQALEMFLSWVRRELQRAERLEERASLAAAECERIERGE